jgi:hypothetical protein
VEVNSSTARQLIQECWNNVLLRASDNPISSEKTLCFLFSLELYKKIGDNLKIDFENQCYDQLQGNHKYLDLLFWTDQNYKVAIEFKLPKHSISGNSNKTEIRKSIYRDLARLNYLKASNLDSCACFLMATNEQPFLNYGEYSIHPEFITAHNYRINSEQCLSINDLELKNVTLIFEWNNIITTDNKHSIDGDYAWLNPIFL